MPLRFLGGADAPARFTNGPVMDACVIVLLVTACLCLALGLCFLWKAPERDPAAAHVPSH